MAMADPSVSRGTRRGTIACHAGMAKADPAPITKVNSSKIQALTPPMDKSQAKRNSTTARKICVHNKSLRRLKRSPSAPAGRANRKIGKAVAACTIDTMEGEEVSSVITQPEVTLNIHVPILEISVAVHKIVKTRCLNGENAELVIPLDMISMQNSHSR